MKVTARHRRSFLAVCVAAIGGFFLFRWFERAQVYFPSREFRASPSSLGRPYEDVYFTAGDGVRLNGWFFAAGADATRSGRVVLVCHGNAGNIGDRLDLCAALLETGVSVFLLDYRGYGRSEGRPGEEGTCLDAVAAWDWLAGKGFAPGRIIAYGESLGGGVAAELAVRKEVGGLVLQSTFTSVTDLGAELFPWLPVRWLSTIHYSTLEKLPRLHVPVMVMHSPTDDLIPYRHAERNFAAANEPKLFWKLEGGHNDAVSDRALFVKGFEEFLRRLPAGAAD